LLITPRRRHATLPPASLCHSHIAALSFRHAIRYDYFAFMPHTLLFSARFCHYAIFAAIAYAAAIVDIAIRRYFCLFAMP